VGALALASPATTRSEKIGGLALLMKLSVGRSISAYTGLSLSWTDELTELVELTELGSPLELASMKRATMRRPVQRAKGMLIGLVVPP